MISQTLGHYQLLEQIGRGGMATVYKAYQPGLDRYVAVKVLPALLGSDAQFMARFQREARAIARLNHPNILPVHDFGLEGEQAYIVMQYIEAGTLKDLLGKPLPLDRTVEIISQVAAALDEAHSQGVLHRDVKPSNILMARPNWALLSDFGLAQVAWAGAKITASGATIGTPDYISPEQGQGLPADARSDIYSLGVVLYEMVTGRVPFDAETPLGVVLKHVSAPLPRAVEFNPSLPEAVEGVLLKTLAKDPADRFASAGEMAAALTEAVAASKVTGAQSPPAVRPVSIVQEHKRIRRPVFWVAVGLVATIVLLTEAWLCTGLGLQRLVGVETPSPESVTLALSLGDTLTRPAVLTPVPAGNLTELTASPSETPTRTRPAVLTPVPVGNLTELAVSPGETSTPTRPAVMAPTSAGHLTELAVSPGETPTPTRPAVMAPTSAGYLTEPAASPGETSTPTQPAVMAPTSAGHPTEPAASPGETLAPTRPAVMAPTSAGHLTEPAASPDETLTPTRPADEMVMVYVPAGEFQMGSTDAEVKQAAELCKKHSIDCDPVAYEKEQPAHAVALSAFWLDRTEVTNAQYRRCVEAGGCSPSRYGDDSRINGDNQPVVGVTWEDAQGYCEWIGARLPTEAQWEYAARGPEERVFPWGNTFDGTKLNYCDSGCSDVWADKTVDDGYEWTAPVGSYPRGVSWCGALDLAGNVCEWVADEFETYPSERQMNPIGTARGAASMRRMVTRGGSWRSPQHQVRSTDRNSASRLYSDDLSGFRCVKDAALVSPGPATATPTGGPVAPMMTPTQSAAPIKQYTAVPKRAPPIPAAGSSLRPLATPRP